MSEHVGGDNPQQGPGARRGRKPGKSTAAKRRAKAAAPAAQPAATNGAPAQQPLTRAAARKSTTKAAGARAPSVGTGAYAPLMAGLVQTFPKIGSTQQACVTWFNAAATVMKLVNGWPGSIAITAQHGPG